MAQVTNSDLLKELQLIESSFDDKITKLNKYYIGRLVHFERQQNIMMEESKNCEQEFNILKTKFKHACGEIKELQFELTTLKKTIVYSSVTLPVKNNIEEANTDDNKVVCDTNVINTTLNNIFIEHGVSKDLITVKNELNTLKQNNILNDVVITGIPEVRNENLLETVNNVLVDYKLEINATDIKNIYRLKNLKCGLNSPVLLQLKNEEIKLSIFEKQKKNGPVVLKTSEKILSINDIQKVYFKHRLTPENLSLLRSVRKFGRDNNYEFIWITITTENFNEKKL